MDERGKRRQTGWLVAFIRGSVFVRLSALFMGIGQWKNKQYTKAVLLFLLEIAYILFMVLAGGKYLIQLLSGSLGSRLSGEIWNEETQVFEKIVGDNSFLILLYGVIAFTISILFILLFRYALCDAYKGELRRTAGEKLPTFRQEIASLFHEKFHALLLFLPLVGLLVFTVMPLVFMWLIAFTSYDFNHMPPGKLFDFVGFANFKRLFVLSGGDFFATAFIRVLIWTFVWAFFATFTNYFLGMFLAMLINKKGIAAKKMWRTFFVLAIAIPQFVTLLLMQKILDRSGILNVLLGKDILWLTDTRWGSLIPRITIIVVNVWIGLPYTMLLTSGLLMNIPKDIYEASKIDGANAFQTFRKITLPYMLQMTTPYLITQFVGNINNFNVIWLLTGGGPINAVLYGNSKAQSTDLLVTWLYRLTTDTNPQYNVASVIGIVVFIVSAVMSLIAFNRSSAARNEEGFQ